MPSRPQPNAPAAAARALLQAAGVDPVLVARLLAGTLPTGTRRTDLLGLPFTGGTL